MNLVFCIFKFHHFGGLQRDFLRIAKACVDHGHQVTVFVSEWQGSRPDFLEIKLMEPARLSNHDKMKAFAELVKPQLSSFDCVIGFNRMPYLDVFFAGESCYVAGAKKKKPWWFFWTRRYKIYRTMEEGVYGTASLTKVLLLSPSEKKLILHYYPAAKDRLYFLPPGIEKNRMPLQGQETMRSQLRKELHSKKFILLMVGSNFKRKGVDRAIIALASLPKTLQAQTQLVVIGDGDIKKAMVLTKKLNISENCVFLGTKENAPNYLLAADLLLHPAREETAGMVILEAIAAHLPLIVAGTCGYAHLVAESAGGEVLSEPFEQQTFNAVLKKALENDLSGYKKSLTAYTNTHDMFGLENAVVDFIEAQGK